MLHFQHPWMLAFLLSLPLWIWLFWRAMQERQKARQLFGNAELASGWMVGLLQGRSTRKFVFWTLGLGALILAAANPGLGSKTQTVRRQGIDLMIALDVSRSMLAQDFKPNRMERARQVAFKLLNEFRGDRVGLIIFAGQAFLQMPMTLDNSAAQLFISTATPDIEISQGTAVEEAIDLTRNLVESDPRQKRRALVIVTDGENHEKRAVAAAKEALSKGVQTFIVGIGTEEGAPIPLPGGDFVRDQEGRQVQSQLNRELMSQVAEAGGGVFLDAAQGDAIFRTLRNKTAQLDKEDFDQKNFDLFDSYFQWPLALGIFFLLIELLLGYRARKKRTTA